MDKLLERDEFRQLVFSRDSGRCVLCAEPAVDAHHIIERRLFDDGGYYLDNGVSVCADDHMAAEQTTVSCEELRDAAGITRVVLPSHLPSDETYTKWGDIVRPDGTRSPGELFFDESVQKVLGYGKMLELYRPYVKYPRTSHLPGSPGASDDDRVLSDLSGFYDASGQPLEVVVTEKFDGENTTMYADHIHARSVDSASHPSQSLLRAFHAQLCGDIPVGWRVCGENLYAQHSIAYDKLVDYFLGFSVWDAANQCLSWDDSLEWFELLGIAPVTVLYRGPFDITAIHESFLAQRDVTASEGYVVRVAGSFAYREFRQKIGKWVRENHVAASRHWAHAPVVANKVVRP